MSRRNPMAAIEARQRAEEAQRHMQHIAAENSKMKTMGRWEESMLKIDAGNEYYRTMDKIQARQDDVLVARRERLAVKLLAEKAEYDSLIAGLGETDAHRRERLMQQARDLRIEREEYRKAQSRKAMKSLALQGSAKVREATSHLKILQVANDRHRQLDEHTIMKKRKADEDKFFTEQWLEQVKQQNARCRQDHEDAFVNARNRQNDLALQVKHNDIRKGEAKQQKAEDDAEFMRLLKEEERKEYEKQDARRRARVALAQEMKETNEELKRIKVEDYERLKAEDRRLLDDILKEVAETEKKEAEAKKAKHEQVRENMRTMKADMEKTMENDTALDKLWQDECDKEWDKKEARWLEDQARREKLLRAVFQNRKDQTIALRLKEAQDAQDKLDERAAIIAKTEMMLQEDMDNARCSRSDQRKVQAYLSEQIAARDAARARENAAKKTELTDTQAQEFAMQSEIDAELRRLDAAKPERYRNVSLLPNRRGLAALENF
eukprot:Tbor_TRINITY_DN3036_c0_g1::TRINITY_DN3036_c0_g1_i1::g.17302::m.17302